MKTYINIILSFIRSTHIGNETDDSDDYFVGYRYHHNWHRHYHHHHHRHHHQKTNYLPDAIDWRDEGAVNMAVPNQDDCGACWAFAVTGAIEGQYFRKTGKMVPLSVQNIIDCSSLFGFECNCNGGALDDAYKYVKVNGGINKETNYPYEALNDVCRYSPDETHVTISGFRRITPGDEDELKEAIATIGPISVSRICNKYFKTLLYISSLLKYFLFTDID